MSENFLFFTGSLPYLALVWVFGIAYHYFRTKKLKFFKFRFSIKNYYLLLSGFLIYLVVNAFQTGSSKTLILLAVFAITGIIGEILASEWWKLFYKERFYVYRVETIVHSYSSFLNFLPWGLGGIFFLNIVKDFGNSTSQNPSNGGGEAIIPFYLIFIIALLIGFLIQWFAFHMFSLKKFTEANLANYTFSVFPFLLALAVCSIVYGYNFILIALTFGIFGSLTEYLFGKTTELFISKKLWVYRFLAIDKGHFTPLSIIPFSALGFYFWGITLFIETLLK